MAINFGCHHHLMAGIHNAPETERHFSHIHGSLCRHCKFVEQFYLSKRSRI